MDFFSHSTRDNGRSTNSNHDAHHRQGSHKGEGTATMKNDMSMNKYQELASRTANYDAEAVIKRLQDNPKLMQLANYALGAAGEAGEAADHIKKVIFHGHDLDEEYLRKEVGDKLWYNAEMARVLGYPLGEVAEENINKLRKRYPEGFSEERSINRED